MDVSVGNHKSNANLHASLTILEINWQYNTLHKKLIQVHTGNIVISNYIVIISIDIWSYTLGN